MLDFRSDDLNSTVKYSGHQVETFVQLGFISYECMLIRIRSSTLVILQS